MVDSWMYFQRFKRITSIWKGYLRFGSLKGCSLPKELVCVFGVLGVLEDLSQKEMISGMKSRGFSRLRKISTNK